MTKLLPLVAFSALLTCISCYKEKRVKPVVVETQEEYYSYPVLGKVETGITNKVDSNTNNSSSSFDISFNLFFKNRGKFTYTMDYELGDYFSSSVRRTFVFSKETFLVDESLQYTKNFRINADSLLKANGRTSSYIRLFIRLKNEGGGVISTPNSGSYDYDIVISHNGETIEKDKEYAVTNFSAYFPGIDANGNNYVQLPRSISVSIYPAPKQNTRFSISVNYRRVGKPTKLLAITKEFTVPASDLSHIALPLEYVIDSTAFEKGHYAFEFDLLKSETEDTLHTDVRSYGYEKCSDDVRTFALRRFELQDTVDANGNHFPCSYKASLFIASSDNAKKTYIAKISYSVYGLQVYNQLTQLVLTSDQVNDVLISGGSLLQKGYYDLQLELYGYDKDRNVIEGDLMAYWSTLDNAGLQAIPLERISEDTP